MEENGTCKFADDIKEIKKTTDKISTALLGDEFSEGVGLIAKFTLLKERVQKIEQRQWWLSGASAVAGFVFGVILKTIF